VILALFLSAINVSPASAPTPPTRATTLQKTELKIVLRDLHRVGDAQSQAPRPIPIRSSWSRRLVSFGGILAMIFIALLMSDNRRRIPWRLVGIGCVLQLIFGVLVLKTQAGESLFGFFNEMVNGLLAFTTEGSRFLFGNLVANNIPVGMPVGDTTMGPVLPSNQTSWGNVGAFFAFGVLPTLIFFSSVTAVCYHLGLLQRVVGAVAWAMRRTLRTSGAESLSAAGNIFLGQTESPLLIRPYVDRMTDSELMAVMVGGFATVAGGVMLAFVGMLSGFFPDIAGHLLAASVMSAPAALVMAKIMVPETAVPETIDGVPLNTETGAVNLIDAAARGAADGLKLALNVGAMLIAFVALVALVNAIFSWFGGFFGFAELSMEWLLGKLLAPLAWVMGIDWADAAFCGAQLGVKTVTNEFVAFLNLAGNLGAENAISGRSAVILTYALCGFANFSSIAIQIGGIGSIAPSRRSDLARLGLRAMIAGNLAAYMTACVVGILL
jgi:CNT family concentrative nucleoside transporter